MTPEIDAWASFWLVTLAGAVTLFLGLSLWVIVAGFFDIRRMFAVLRAQAEDGDDSGD